MPTERQHKFEGLINPQLNSLYTTALRMTRNQNDAQDLVQETLYKAFRYFDQFRENTNFRAWVFRILVNTYITAYRKNSRQPQQVSYDDLEEYYLYKKLDDNVLLQDTAKEDFLEALFDDEVKEALENIPDQFRLVILLCDLEEFSYTEIASMIDVPLGTVMSRLFRGRKLLQQQLWSYASQKGYKLTRQSSASRIPEFIAS